MNVSVASVRLMATYYGIARPVPIVEHDRCGHRSARVIAAAAYVNMSARSTCLGA